MHLAFLAPANSVHSEKWIRWFANAGHRITWLSAHPFTGDPIPGVTMRVLPQGRRSPRRLAEWLWTVSRELRAASPDMVHVHSLGTYALLALAVPRRTPTVVTPWGSDLITDMTTPWRRAIVRRAVGRGRLFTCDAEHMRTRLAALGADASQVHIINFGIDTARFADIAHRRQVRAAQSDAASTPLRIVSLRSLDPVYDHPTLLRATADLVRRGVPIAVKLYGGGPELSRLQEMARTLGVADVVSFCGKYSQATLPGILEEADLYVSTSTSDAGIASSTAEAMAAGVPVIVSDSGDNTSWIADGINGRLFRTGDDQALARAIADVARDPAESRRWGEAGRHTILERNDYSTEMRKMQDLYASVAP